MRVRVLLVAAIGVVGAVVASAMEIEVARSRDVDFSAYTSFGFRVKDGIPPEHPLGEDGHMLKEVQDAAAETLLRRGMTLIKGDTPDVWVSFFGLREEEYTAEGVRKELGGVTWVGDPGAHSTRTVQHATLIVEIYDASTDERIWSGWATGSTSNPEKIRARAAKATRKVLEEFPRE